MDLNFFLNKFKQAADGIDVNLLNQKNLRIDTGIWLNSTVLRLQKERWANKPDEQPQTGAAIFFSIWLNEVTIKKNAIFYNIHALKLRKLSGYNITSRQFAADFRERFKNYRHNWPNVSTDFGPLTLMEGWKQVDIETMQYDILEVAEKFMSIDFMIDELLDNYRSVKP